MFKNAILQTENKKTKYKKAVIFFIYEIFLFMKINFSLKMKYLKIILSKIYYMSVF